MNADTQPIAAQPVAAQGAAAVTEDQVVEVLRTIFDPEIPVNIYEMGLIYDIEIDGGRVEVKMTLTSPACPVAGTLPGEVEAKIEGLPGIERAAVEIVWDPVWNPGMMSEAAKLELGMMDYY